MRGDPLVCVWRAPKGKSEWVKDSYVRQSELSGWLDMLRAKDKENMERGSYSKTNRKGFWFSIDVRKKKARFEGSEWEAK